MKRRLIFHIGIPKTGSTSLQQVLSAGRAELFRNGVFYPKSFGIINHFNLVTMVREKPSKMNAPAGVKAVEDVREKAMRRRFVEEMTNLPARVDTVVISHENFSFSEINPAEFVTLHEIFEPHFDRMEIVAYLRRQDEHYASLFTERLRNGYLRRPLPYRETPEQRVFYHFDTMLEGWAKAFPHALIRPRIFEKPAAGKFDVIEDFCTLIGVKVPQVNNEMRANTNVSINAAAQRVLLQMKSAMKDEIHSNGLEVLPTWQRITGTAEKILAGKGWRMNAAESAAFMANYAEGNETVRKLYFPERPALFADAKFPAGVTGLPDSEVALDAACHMIRDLSEQVRDERFKMASLMTELGRKFGDLALERQGMQLQVATKPASLEANLAYARYRIGEGQVAEAAASVVRALKVDPHNVEARQLLEEMRKRERKAVGAEPAGSAVEPDAPVSAEPEMRFSAHAQPAEVKASQARPARVKSGAKSGEKKPAPENVTPERQGAGKPGKSKAHFSQDQASQDQASKGRRGKA